MELFLSICVLFYRIGGGLWPAAFNADAHKGVAGVSIVEGLLLLSLTSWLEIAVKHRLSLNPLVVGAVFLLLFFTNYYLLIARGIGVSFEKKFGHFKLGKRILLRSLAIAIVLASVFVFYVSMSEHQQVFS